MFKKCVKKVTLMLMIFTFIFSLFPFYVKAEENTSTEESTSLADYSPLYELAEKYGFKLGTMMNYNRATSNTKYQEAVSRHFNSITPTNEMKPYSLLDQTLSQQSEDGMPRMDYTSADAIMDFAVANGIQVRGHVLVWDNGMNEGETDWFFHEDYDSSKPYVSEEVLEERMEYYIRDVITHFQTKYPDVIYAWDVVNEAVGDSDTEYASEDDRHVRTMRSGKENLLYKIWGENYVEKSFQIARDVVDEIQVNDPDFDIKLFYNDYNTFKEDKRDAICNLLTSINSYDNGRKLCDGVGMQSYIGGYGVQEGCMEDSDIALLKQAIEKYASLGLEVQITEMALRNYDSSEEALARHVQFYVDMFDMLTDINTQENNPLTSVSIWGIADDPTLATTNYSYKMNGPYCGLLDENFDAKQEFIQVHKLLETKKESTSQEVDKTALAELVEKVKDTESSGYTPGSWETFASALTRANAALDNENATQAEVNRLVIILGSSYDALTVRGMYLDEIIKNGDINGSIDNWNAHEGATLGKGYSTRRSSPNSLKISDAIEEGSGAKQDITDRVSAGETYNIVAYVLYKSDSTDNTNPPEKAVFNVSVLYGEDETKEVMISSEVQLNEWGEISGSYTIPDTVDTSKVSLLLESPAITGDQTLIVFYADDISMQMDVRIKLQEVIADYNEIESTYYTEESWSDFQNALINARELVEAEDSTNEELVDILNLLNNAKSSLEVYLPEELDELVIDSDVDSDEIINSVSTIIDTSTSTSVSTSASVSISTSDEAASVDVSEVEVAEEANDNDFNSVTTTTVGAETESNTETFKVDDLQDNSKKTANNDAKNSTTEKTIDSTQTPTSGADSSSSVGRYVFLGFLILGGGSVIYIVVRKNNNVFQWFKRKLK